MVQDVCRLCEQGICPQSGLTLKQLRRRLARRDNKRKYPKRVPVPSAEACLWCGKLIPFGVNCCPQPNCGEIIRFTISNYNEMINFYNENDYE